MNYKRDFIKRERVTDKKIPLVKEPYRGMSWTNNTDENTNNKDKKALRKDEPFVLMFRDFLFFDVKSYECRYGDLYIRNLVDGIILKRYFRMNANDQLTVFKNRKEFDEFMDKVKNNGYLFGPIDKKSPLSVSIVGSASATNDYPGRTPKGSHQEYIKKLSDDASKQFVLESYVPVRDPNTGDIVSIKSTWDGESFTYEDSPLFFDKVAKVFEEAHINDTLCRKGGTY
jgi:hypothetical protein